MGTPISNTVLSETLTLSEYKDGFWLYDKTRGMNLSMRAKDERAAFVEALMYYQRRLLDVELKHKALSEKVEAFVSQFREENDE